MSMIYTTVLHSIAIIVLIITMVYGLYIGVDMNDYTKANEGESITDIRLRYMSDHKALMAVLVFLLILLVVLASM